MTPLECFNWKQSVQPSEDLDLPTTPHSIAESVDDGLSIDDYTDISESIMSEYASAGESVRRYKKQLMSNLVQDMEGGLNLVSFGMANKFDGENLDTFASQLPLNVMQQSLSDLAKMKDDLNVGSYQKEEWPLHVDLTIQLARLIDPNPDTIQGGGRKLFAVTAPAGWNRAPLCLVNAGYKNLSMPKMDVCFALAFDQRNTDELSPLWEICSKFFPEDKRAKAVDLLSLDKMHQFNAYEKFADVAFMPITEAQLHGNYPISIFEVKKSDSELGIAVMQIVNTGLFLCGKQIDLMLATEQSAQEIKLPDGFPPFALGMSVTGKHWQINIVALMTESTLIKPRFIYDKIAEGDWVENPKRFFAAALLMHETMLERHVRLLAYCYDVFEQKIAADTENELRRRNSPTDNLAERTIIKTLSKAAK